MTDTKTPIVFIHGWGAAPTIWQPLIDALPQHNIINLSLPAYNNDGNWQQPVEYMLAQLPSRCHLVGWSLGGNIAAALAEIAPEQVASLVTVASVPVFVANKTWPWAMDAKVFKLFASSVKKDPLTTLKRFAALEAKGADSERSVLKSLRGMSDTATSQALIDSLAWLAQCDQQDLWQQLNLPRQHIFCQGDALIPISAAAHCDHSVILPAAGHAPMQSVPSGLAALLTAFWGQ